LSSTPPAHLTVLGVTVCSWRLVTFVSFPSQHLHPHLVTMTSDTFLDKCFFRCSSFPLATPF
jgi:hypothetical protein